MKVICINDKDLLRVKFGEIHPVLGEREEYYLLFIQCGLEYYYLKNRFIPLSDIDETELLAIREQDKIYH